jgi:hypothetical protein
MLGQLESMAAAPIIGRAEAAAGPEPAWMLAETGKTKAGAPASEHAPAQAAGGAAH